MLKFVTNSEVKQFIIATETGIIHALKKQNPNAEFLPASSRGICPNMKKISVDKIIASLENMQYEIKVAEEIRLKAKKALDRMVEILPDKKVWQK
jgi:quinolinate synthase